LSANGNGFTVASEEPVYVLGRLQHRHRRSVLAERKHTHDSALGGIHHGRCGYATVEPTANNTSPSTNTGWTDYESFEYPGCAVKTGNCTIGRYGNTSYYRMAIIAGKSIPFPNPGWSTEVDFGTDEVCTTSSAILRTAPTMETVQSSTMPDR